MRAAIIRGGIVENVVLTGGDYQPPSGTELFELDDDSRVGPGWTYRDGVVEPPTPLPPPPPSLQEWAATAQAELTAQRAILDLLLLGGLDDDGGTIDGEIGSDLPDSGGTLDDLEGLDLGTLPDSGETLDDLDLALEG